MGKNLQNESVVPKNGTFQNVYAAKIVCVFSV